MAGEAREGRRHRVVFMGTPQFALPVLEGLVADHEVVGVVSQPDRPAGRGRRLAAPPVAARARELGLPLLQPETLRNNDQALNALRAWQPEVLVVAAFGLFLPTPFLTLAPGGALNVHASLLPRWRGAAPVQHAILAGDAETGVTIILMDEAIDHGPILAQQRTAIDPNETAGELTERLARSGAELLLATLPDWLAGHLTPRAQDDSQATAAPRLRPEDGRLSWRESAAQLARRVRAMTPCPGAFLDLAQGRLAVQRASVVPPEASLPPGMLTKRDGFPVLVTVDGWLRLDVVQPACRRPMTGDAFLCGYRELVGSVVPP